MQIHRVVVPVFLVAILIPALAQGQPNPRDAQGCSDPSLFPKRMAGYRIGDCSDKAFDSFTFHSKVGKQPDTPVEGRHIALTYYWDTGKNDTTNLAVMRNYEAAIKSAGGSIVAIDPQGYVVGKFVRDGKEIWTEVRGYPGASRIYLHIVESKAMEQQVVADAEAFSSDLQQTGHVAVYGILFDTNKSTLKPESEAAIKEVAKLLIQNPALKLLVVGHTDSVGVFDQNMVLSKERADAVVKALTTTHGIAAARLKAVGCGPAAPVASNKTEEGRARNRRVELVEQ